jgi:hypothetical protein
VLWKVLAVLHLCVQHASENYLSGDLKDQLISLLECPKNCRTEQNRAIQSGLCGITKKKQCVGLALHPASLFASATTHVLDFRGLDFRVLKPTTNVVFFTTLRIYLSGFFIICSGRWEGWES